MSTPGVSLFQGAESIQINNSHERAEEEEALADQRRRDEELGNILQNAFDDLEDDETVDSSTNFQSDLLELPKLQEQQHHFNDNNNAMLQQQQQENLDKDAEIHKLKMLLDSQTYELQNIKEMANDEYKKREELQKRLCIAEAELNRALVTKQNSHELLVASKERCSNLENTVEKLRSEKKLLESENNTLLGKLETAQTLLSDVQHKYDMVERDLNKHDDRNAELRRKQMEERHNAAMEMMQQQLEQLANKLEKKSNELENMSTRYNALQSSHELMLVDKASRINDLNNALSEAQKQCDQLRCKQDYFQENVRLQKLVANLQSQIEAMERTIASLNERLEFTTNELEAMDSVLHQYNLEDTPRRLSQTQGRVVGSTPLNTAERVGNLKDELCRALANVKSKRDDIRKLQQTLEEKQTEIRTLQDEENKSLVQITTLKEDKIRLENRVRILEEECEQLRQKTHNSSLNSSKVQTLNEQLKQLKADNVHLEEQQTLLERERSKQELERKKLDVQLKNVEVDLEELKQEYESMKTNYEQIMQENQKLRQRTTSDCMRLELEKHKFLLKDAQAECDRLKNLYIEISNVKETLSYEIEKLRNQDHVKELQEQREKFANLQRALQLAEVKSSELSKILETEKHCHEREVNELRERIEKARGNMLKESKDTANNCTKCIDYMTEITKFEIQNLKLTNANQVHKKEIDELTMELTQTKAHIIVLNEKLKMSEHQEQLIKELKCKATQFEDFIKTHSSASEKSTTTPKQTTPNGNSNNTSSDKGVGTSPELEQVEIKKLEARIRDEMAKIFANELRRFQNKLQQTEDKMHCLQREYEHVSGELQQRQNEVELLKQAILAEREHMKEFLKGKESESQQIIAKHKALLSKCREELQAKNEKITELSEELVERQTQIEAERRSMKAVMLQWDEQRKSSNEIEAEWKAKLQELQQTHASAIEAYKSKYNSAKRTAVNYKRYADDKEAHMIREYERIKFEYDASLAKIEVHMKQVLQKKAHEMKTVKGGAEKHHDNADVDSDFDKENQSSNQL